MRQVWRHFWAQRSRWQMVLALMCVMAALVAVGLVYVPGAWLAQAGTALQAVGAYVLSFGTRAWLFAAGGALVVCAVLLVVLPRRRPHSYLIERPSAIAPVSVYVDAENQLQNSKLVRPFVRYLRTYLREHLRGQRADLLYFANAMQPETRATYKELYRFGFRPVDVPHAPFEDENIKDAVDMELSLHAYDRALRGPDHQVFIIVTGDRDFLPLIFRLHALGHTVHIWAKQPPKAFRKIESFLDSVRYISLREIFPPDTQSPAEGVTGVTKEGRGAATKEQKTSPTDATLQPISIQQAIAYTLDTLHESHALIDAAPNPEMKLRQLLGNAHDNFLRRLGFDRGDRVAAWLEMLIALGVLARGERSIAPSREAPDLAKAVMYMEQVLQGLVAVVVALADQSSDHSISYTAVARSVSAEARLDEPAELQRLRALLALPSHRGEAYVGYCCRCARKLGMLHFDELMKGTSIRVQLPSSSAFGASEATPSADEPHEQGHNEDHDERHEAAPGEEMEI